MTQKKAGPDLRQTQEQFARQARRYAESVLHRRGQTLDIIVRLAAVQPHERALDVGTGAGFTAFTLAPAAGLVIAADPTGEMLAEARRLAQERRHAEQIQWAQATAEALPLASGSVDVITCRFASHHFQDLQELRPSRDELLAAARWTMSHDPSAGFRGLLITILEQLGVEHADAALG